MGFHFKPLPVEVLRDKVPIALNKIWIVDEAAKDRPGLHAENVFDFEGGIRLIISRDKFPYYPDPIIHISASCPRTRRVVKEKVLLETLEKIKLGGVVDFIGTTPMKVSHWFLTLRH